MSKISKRTDDKKNKSKKQNKFNTFVIPVIFFTVIISVVVVACVSCAKRRNNHGTSIDSTTVNVSDYLSGDEYLKINATDCTLYVGDMVKLTCSSYPETYSLGVNWRSSDTTVLTVTYDGMVTAIKTGTVAITATNGVLSDAIIIQVIEEDETVPDDFPIYEPQTPGKVPDETTSSNLGIEDTQSSTSAPAQSEETQTTMPSQENTSPYEEPTATEPESTTVAEPETITSQETTTPPEEETTTETVPEETTIDAREFILYNLPEFGFKQYINDTFVYKEDGNYLGQAIVELEFTQIYVMTRTTGFDGKIKDFLKVFFPTGYATVFNKFANAASDTTFYADGYKVRVITSPGGGHRQLIIYY